MRYLLIIYFLFAGISRGQTIYKNLVFEGGGVRGLAYAGVIKVLEEQNVLSQIERTAGTSAGAIAALLVSLDFSADDIDSILRNIKFQQFNDGRGGLIGKYKRIKNRYGIYAGDKLEHWLEELIELKTGDPDLSFGGLHYLHETNSRIRDFACTGTNLTQQRVEVFSYSTTPDLPLKTAVRISIAIPFYYKPVFLDSNYKEIKEPLDSTNYNIMVDGGFVSNFPITLFDSCLDHCGKPLICDSLERNNATLGIKLERPEQIDIYRQQLPGIAPFTIYNFNQFMHAFGNLLMNTLNYHTRPAYEKGRTIYVSDGNISPRVRKMKDSEKDLLVNNGKKGAEEFFGIKQRNSGTTKTIEH